MIGWGSTASPNFSVDSSSVPPLLSLPGFMDEAFGRNVEMLEDERNAEIKRLSFDAVCHLKMASLSSCLTLFFFPVKTTGSGYEKLWRERPPRLPALPKQNERHPSFTCGKPQTRNSVAVLRVV